MTLKQLEIFMALAKNPHLSNVAKEKGLTQSAVSMAIKSLEDSLQDHLFDRIHKKLVLNEKGRMFFDKIAPLVTSLNEAEKSFKKNKLSGELIIGVSLTLSTFILPNIIFEFMDNNADVSVKMRTGNTKEVITWIENGKVDLGFVEGEFESDDLIKQVFGIDELMVVTGNKILAGKSEHDIEDLYTKRWLIREKGSGTREIFLSHLGDHSRKINIFLVLDQADALKSVLTRSDCLCCLSQFTVKKELEEEILFRLHIKGHTFKRMFYTVRHAQKYESLLFKTFIDFAQKKGVELN